MQKGVVMQVQLYITGDDAPAHDFTQTGHDVALQVLQQGLAHYSGPYAVQVQKVQPVEGGDDDSDEPASGDALDVKPLLSYTPAAESSSQASPSGPSANAAPNTSGASASSTPASLQPLAQPHAQPPAPGEPEKPEEQPKHHFWDR